MEKPRKEMENPKGLENQEPEPRDTHRIAYLIHFLLGAGNLLPWNAFITAVDYFSHLYPNKQVEKTFAVVYMSSSVMVLVVMLTWPSCFKSLSYKLRLNFGFSIYVICIMVSPVIDWCWKGKKLENGAYGLTVGSVLICGLADGLIGGSLIGSAGKLPKQYMQAVFAGTASSGVLVSVMRIVTKASIPQTPEGLRTSTHFYFIVSFTILLCCTLCSNLLFRKHYRVLSQDGSSPTTPSIWEVGRKIKCPAFGILLIYLVTLSIFPGFIADNLKSNNLKSWYPVMLITIYNVSDFVGKSLTAIYTCKSINKATWACVGRLLFYPAFAACLHGPIWLRIEATFGVLTFMLGLTNGYLTSVLMILTPKSVSVAEAELAGVFLAVFLGFGLFVGSVLGWFWVI